MPSDTNAKVETGLHARLGNCAPASGLDKGYLLCQRRPYQWAALRRAGRNGNLSLRCDRATASPPQQQDDW